MNRNGWTYKKLGEVCKVQAGQGAPQGDANYSDSGIPFVKAGNLIELIEGKEEYAIQKVSEEVAKKHRLKLYKSGSVLFAKSGMSCMKGYVYTLHHDCYVVSHLAVLQPYNVSSKYLHYFLQYNKPNKLVKDEAYPSISLSDIENIIISLPNDKDKEKIIVQELDSLNDSITMLQQQVKDLDALAQSIFYDMFGDPYTNNKGFNVIRLGDICSAQNGLVDPREAPYCDMYHIGPANIVSHTGDIVDLKISKNENLISGKYLFDVGMVLYSKIRPNLNKVAKANFKGICSSDMYPLIPKENITTEYLYFVLRSNKFLEYAVLNSGRANIPKINREALFAYDTLLPPLGIQKSFDSKIAKVEESKASLNTQITEMQNLLASRMQYWFD